MLRRPHFTVLSRPAAIKRYKLERDIPLKVSASASEYARRGMLGIDGASCVSIRLSLLTGSRIDSSNKRSYLTVSLCDSARAMRCPRAG